MFSKGSKAFSFTLIVVLAAVMAWGPVASASEPFVGEIRIFGFNFAPRGWAFCDGQLLPISQNQALFSLLGTTYGGDGRTTFGLPDLRGRVAIGQGTGPGLTPRSIGQRSGYEMVTLTVGQMPSHSHTAIAKGNDNRGNQETPGNHIWAKKSRDDDYSSNAPDVDMSPAAIVINNSGGNQAHDNMPPWLAVNYSIALVGLYPSRS